MCVCVMSASVGEGVCGWIAVKLVGMKTDPDVRACVRACVCVCVCV